VGVLERRILEEYGNIARWNGPLGVRFSPGCREYLYTCADITVQEERLWITDPKAVHRILQGSGYLYEKLSSSRERLATITDKGLVWAVGELPLASPMV